MLVVLQSYPSRVRVGRGLREVRGAEHVRDVVQWPAVSRTVPIPCPNCAAVTSAVIYRHFDIAALMCPECEHVWQMNADAHPVLLTIPLFKPRH